MSLFVVYNFNGPPPPAMMRMAGAIGKSTDVMKAMQSLIKVPEIQQSMMELSREMAKAGLIEEMMEDTFEGLEDDDLDELADTEVEKILFEVTNGILGQAGPVSNRLPATEEPQPAEPAAEEGDEDLSERLQALRS